MNDTQNAERLHPGVVLNEHYRLVRSVGTGNFGEVFLATDLHLDHPVAVKVLRLDRVRDCDTALRLFESEAKLAVNIDHPNVVRILDLDRHREFHFLVMEYLDGSDLSVLLKEVKRLPLAVALRITSDSLCGLGALHQKSIVHRDLKPQNILIRRDDNRVKLSDFGLAKSLEIPGSLTGGAVVGTPCYMAPELWTGNPATPASDVFAMGVTLFECLMGEVPWNTHDLVSLMDSVKTDSPPAVGEARSDVPPELDEFLSMCLAKDPQARPPDALAAEKELRLLENGEDETNEAEERLLRNRIAIVGLSPDMRAMVRACISASGLLSPVLDVGDCGSDELLQGLGQLDAILLDPQCRPPGEIGEFVKMVRHRFRSIVFFLLQDCSRDPDPYSDFPMYWQNRFRHFFKLHLDTAFADLPGLVTDVTQMIVFDQTVGLSR